MLLNLEFQHLHEATLAARLRPLSVLISNRQFCFSQTYTPNNNLPGPNCGLIQEPATSEGGGGGGAPL